MIRKQLLLLTTFFLLVSGICVAQKIKYKDLFYLLNAKKYNEAEPFLKSFLSNPKESDHPNANFQMALIYHEKSKVDDVLLDTETKLMNIDSAIHYYTYSKILITEKEIKKNDEYYEAYYRRDLRTGKMGIKMSDIHLDIETRTSKLERDKLNITKLKNYFVNARDYYTKAKNDYKTLVDNFETQNQFYLRSDDETINQLAQIKSDYDSSMGNFGRYKIVLQEMEFPGYMQTLKVNDIKDIKKDGLDEADFLNSTIITWNYDKWVNISKKIISNEVKTLHDALIDYDERLDEFLKSIEENSKTVKEELSNLKMDELQSSIAPFDDDPFPFSLFELKKAEIRYLSDKMELFKTKDSVYIDKQFKLTNNLLGQIQSIDSVINNKVGEKKLSQVALDYKPLIDKQYGGIAGLNAFVKKKRDLVNNDRQQIESDLELLKEKSKWLIVNSDSIPLFKNESNNVLSLSKDKTYIHFEKIRLNDSLNFTTGIYYDFNGSPFLYFSPITPTHITGAWNKIKLEPATFSTDSINLIKITKIVDEGLNTYLLVYNTNYSDHPMNAHLLKVKNDLTLGWEKAIKLIYPPDVLTVSNDFGVIAINYDLNYIDKSNGLQLISRELYNMLTGELIKEKK